MRGNMKRSSGGRRTLFVFGLVFLVMGIGIPASPAYIIAPPEPDAILGDDAPEYPIGIPGLFEAPPVPPIPGLAGAVPLATADCKGCLPHNRMYWTNYGWWESVGIDYSYQSANEVIEEQAHHVALLNGEEGCYSGGYKSTQSDSDYNQQSSSDRFHTGKYTSFNDTWTQAAGYYWREDGLDWEIQPPDAMDICKDF